MPETTVHWLGTGLSTGSGLRAVADAAARTVLWARSPDKADALLHRLDLTGRVESRALPPSLDPRPRPGDVVVSMLPASEHPAVLRRCLDAGAHFACSSYDTEQLGELADTAGRDGLVVLTESGVDPGLDHAFAHDLIDRARTALGDAPAAITFTSYCGGIPAVANDFRYRFSWSPLGVLNALRQPARYLADGAERLATEPWEHTTEYSVGGEKFEVYPNRDSVPFLAQYGIPDAWRPHTFVRGTLRLPGWHAAWQDVFAEVRTGDPGRIAALAEDLAARYPMTPTDHDRVVLTVALDVHTDDGRTWTGAHHLDLAGTATESAMARAVSLPLAHGVNEILSGHTAPGRHHLADTGPEARRCLEFLHQHGVRTEARTPTGDPAPQP
ncbi:MAG TPA: saccharopine dehydrogenase family protein [Actinophytocola sp.]|uniref:saccharopine dehydrogenase family protein n=1 Tax=Actinophytocola sp. TaxID=1872138 RepID=UPI002DBFE543|nr:saccharopine dehydrogenase family protein [Actinophytocola sp.]HEU5474272.1 saccharopine dehydrogenase family protein [Actinophytocola sp.]